MSGPNVDLALVLSMDCSSSMDDGDFGLQRQGLAMALSDPAMIGAVAAGRWRQIAISVVQWSNRTSQVITFPWTVLAQSQDFVTAAGQIKSAPRLALPGGTGLAAGIAFSRYVLARSPFVATRLAIDVSGDGMENEGGDVVAERDRTLASGATINGLPIVSGSVHLVSYYRSNVIGGIGSFLVPTDTSLTFAKAIRDKLFREIAQPLG